MECSHLLRGWDNVRTFSKSWIYSRAYKFCQVLPRLDLNIGNGLFILKDNQIELICDIVECLGITQAGLHMPSRHGVRSEPQKSLVEWGTEIYWPEHIPVCISSFIWKAHYAYPGNCLLNFPLSIMSNDHCLLRQQ